MFSWKDIGDQLRHPSGGLGRLTGLAMRIVNHQPNRLALRALDVRVGDDVLELGFGPGEAIRDLARLAPHGVVQGVDHSPTMLAQAVARNVRAVRRGQVRLQVGRFQELPVPCGSVDRILAANVVYFWGAGDEVLWEIDRVLRPGGRISLYATAAATMRRWRFAGPETHRVFSADELAAYLARGPFAPWDVAVTEVKLWSGMRGLLAVIDKPLTAKAGAVSCGGGADSPC